MDFDGVIIHDFELDLLPRRVEDQFVVLSSVPRLQIARDLKCPICLDPMVNAVVIECCLNRFCKECIIKYLQQIGTQKRECPTCKHPTNHRKLKPDDRMNNLIPLLTQNANVDSMDVTLATRIYEQQVLKMRKRQRDKQIKLEELKAKLAATTDYSRVDYADQSEEVPVGETTMFSLFRHPEEKTLPAFEYEYVRVSSDATMSQVKKFVLLQLEASSQLLKKVVLFVQSPSLGLVPVASIAEGEVADVGGQAVASKRLLYRINDDKITLRELSRWCSAKELPLDLVYRLSK